MIMKTNRLNKGVLNQSEIHPIVRNIVFKLMIRFRMRNRINLVNIINQLIRIKVRNINLRTKYQKMNN